LVELKSGETYNGTLVSCDTWMNLHLREVICTSKARLPAAATLARNPRRNAPRRPAQR
jgi:small nuclear ribonucleoprotein (snRNP)-like protein